MRDRIDRLAAGFRVRGERENLPFPAGLSTSVVGPACVQVRRSGSERLELTPDEADALAEALRTEAAFARGEAP